MPNKSLNVKYALDRVNRREGYSMKKPFRSSARGASFHTKHTANAYIDRIKTNVYLVVNVIKQKFVIFIWNEIFNPKKHFGTINSTSRYTLAVRY
jgi:hypothetical protein